MSAGAQLLAVAVIGAIGLALGMAANSIYGYGAKWWRKILGSLVGLVAAGVVLFAVAGLITVVLTADSDDPTYPCDDCPTVGNPGG